MPRTGRPKSENPKGERLRVRIELDVKEAFAQKCEELGLNQSDLIRQWILEFLENKKK